MTRVLYLGDAVSNDQTYNHRYNGSEVESASGLDCSKDKVATPTFDDTSDQQFSAELSDGR